MCVVGLPLCEPSGTVREVASLCIFRCKASHVDEKQSSLSIATFNRRQHTFDVHYVIEACFPL